MENKNNSIRVAILRFENLPSFVTWDIPDLDKLLEDDKLIISGFEKLGHQASSVIWSDPDVDWNKFDIAIIRSPWDYIDRPEEFLKILSVIDASSCKLYNPLKAVQWNSDKHYLFDLEKWGVPIVPTFRSVNSDTKEVIESFEKKNLQGVILKPTIGGGGANVIKINTNETFNKLESLKGSHPQHNFFIQPLVESVMTEGEWSFIYINGKPCHTLLKKPKAGDYRAHGIYGGTVELTDPYRKDVVDVGAILKKIPFDLLYARIDLVRIEGRLSIMELELIEPILYFNLAPDGIKKFVNAAVEKVTGNN